MLTSQARGSTSCVLREDSVQYTEVVCGMSSELGKPWESLGEK